MYVLQRCGPTSFIVKEDASGEQNHVTIGSLQKCTCRRDKSQSNMELCRHLVFVMVKVLAVPPDNPLAWQLSLVGVTRALVIDRLTNQRSRTHLQTWVMCRSGA